MVTIIPIVIGAFGTVTIGLLNYRIIKGTGGFGSWRLSGDQANNSIIENGQNTEKSPGGDLLSLKLQWKTMLIWKTLKE